MNSERISGLIAMFMGIAGLIEVGNISEKYKIGNETVELRRYLTKNEIVIYEKNTQKSWGDRLKNGTVNYLEIKNGDSLQSYNINELTIEQKLEAQNQFNEYMEKIKIEKLKEKGFFNY